MTYLLGLLVAGVLFVVGVWGSRQAATLVPAYLPEQDRARRERTLRRGALACRATAAAVVLTTLGSLVLSR